MERDTNLKSTKRDRRVVETTPARTSPCARGPSPLHMASLPPSRVKRQSCERGGFLRLQVSSGEQFPYLLPALEVGIKLLLFLTPRETSHPIGPKSYIFFLPNA